MTDKTMPELTPGPALSNNDLLPVYSAPGPTTSRTARQVSQYVAGAGDVANVSLSNVSNSAVASKGAAGGLMTINGANVSMTSPEATAFRAAIGVPPATTGMNVAGTNASMTGGEKASFVAYIGAQPAGSYMTADGTNASMTTPQKASFLAYIGGLSTATAMLVDGTNVAMTAPQKAAFLSYIGGISTSTAMLVSGSNASMTGPQSATFRNIIGIEVANLTQFNAAITAGWLTIFMRAGNYDFPAVKTIPPGTTIYGEAGTLIRAASGFVNTDAPRQQIFNLSAGCTLRDLAFDGLTRSGGVCAVDVSGLVLENVYVTNCGVFQGIQTTGCSNVRMESPKVLIAAHGIQLWNTTDVVINNPDVNRVDGGGVWTAKCDRISVYGGYIRNCADVGLDFEGGSDCYGFNNRVERCGNGELAIFETSAAFGAGPWTSARLQFHDPVVHRQATYINTSGATVACNNTLGAAGFWVASVDATMQQCGVFGGNFAIDFGCGFGSNDVKTGNKDISFCASVVTHNNSSPLFSIGVRAQGWTISVDHWRVLVAPTSTPYKNAFNGVFCNTSFECTATLSAPLIYIYTDEVSAGPILFRRNAFSGCGANALWVDQFVTGPNTVILEENALTTSPQLNGGLTVSANGQPQYRGQRIDILLPPNSGTSATVDVSTMPFGAVTTYGPAGNGVLRIFGANAYNLSYYPSALISRDGSGPGTGYTFSATTYATFSGSVATVTKPAGAWDATLTMVLESFHS